MKNLLFIPLFVLMFSGCQSPQEKAIESPAVSGEVESAESTQGVVVEHGSHVDRAPAGVGQSSESEEISSLPETLSAPTREEWENSFLSQIEAIEIFNEDEFSELDSENADPFEILFSNPNIQQRGIARYNPCKKRSRMAVFLNPGPESGRGYYLKGRYFRKQYVENQWASGRCFYYRRSGAGVWGKCKQKGINKNRRLNRKCPVRPGSSWVKSSFGKRKGKRYKRKNGGYSQRGTGRTGRSCILKGRRFRDCSYLYKRWKGGDCYYGQDKGFRRCKKGVYAKNRKLNYECRPGESRLSCRRRYRSYYSPKRRVRRVRRYKSSSYSSQ